MAVIRVNWDQKGASFLDNYVPFVHEALDRLETDIFSIDDFKNNFKEIAEFSIPTGALLSLLKHAERKYELIERQRSGEYKIVKERLSNDNFSSIRDEQQEKFRRLATSFARFASKVYGQNVNKEEVGEYFFEILYDIAPTLFMSHGEINNEVTFTDEASSNPTNKYMVAKYVSDVQKNEPDTFDIVLSFVRGSMLTETFYYSQNVADIENKPLRRTEVYFDTQFLARVLGFADESVCTPCIELVDMLQELGVKMRCFRQTLNELHGIFHAAISQFSSTGRLNARAPGDIFDSINHKGISPSDLVVYINKIEEELKEKKIWIQEKPELISEYSINESKFSEILAEVFEQQTDKARNHDISCIQAIWQLRFGRVQSYLDKCKAIFVTTNSSLAWHATRFFNEEYGHSNAPVCMSDHVFTALVWMKSAKKVPDIPKDRLVANCYSALLPSESLWGKYINEVNNLMDKGTINEQDYHVLVNSLVAREQVMVQSFSNDDNIFGSVESILKKAKDDYNKEVNRKLEVVESASAKKTEQIENFINKIEKVAAKLTASILATLWAVTLGLMFFKSEIPSINPLEFSVELVAFSTIVIMSILSLFFGFRLWDICKSLGHFAIKPLSRFLRRNLF